MEAHHVPMLHAKRLQLKREALRPCPRTATGVAGTLSTLARAQCCLETPGFPAFSGLTGLAARGSYYTLLYPTTMFGCTIASMLWFDARPIAPETPG